VWWPYFAEECSKRGVTTSAVLGGDRLLAPWLQQMLVSTPPLRMRERAWMRLSRGTPDVGAADGGP
jgi:hypothetical protein